MALKNQLTDDEKKQLRLDLIERLRLLAILADTSLSGLAVQYGVSQVTIWRIDKGEYDEAASRVLTLVQIMEIKSAREVNRVTQEALDGYKIKVMADRNGISVQTLYRYLWRLQDGMNDGRTLTELWEAA